MSILREPYPATPWPRRSRSRAIPTTERFAWTARCGWPGGADTITDVAATLEELEARVAALEAERVDYRAVLAAVNALGANQSQLARNVGSLEQRLGDVEERLGTVESELHTHGGYLRSLDEGQAELKDLLIRALDTRE